MEHLDLVALTDFNLVIEHGGFGRAARATRSSKATLSRRVKELEETLGVRLVERGSQGLQLTEEGRALHQGTSPLLAEIGEVADAIVHAAAEPKGLLRISTPLLFGQVAMGRLAAEFLGRFPDVRLDVVAEDRMVDMVAEAFDVAIRVNPAPQEGLVGKCFMRDSMVVVAHPSTTLPPAAGSEPAPVRAVVLNGNLGLDLWTVGTGAMKRTIRPVPLLTLSSLVMVRDAVRAGAGVGLLPRSMVLADIAAGRLVALGAATDIKVELWVLYTSRRLRSSKVAAFVDFLAAAFADASGEPFIRMMDEGGRQ